MAAAHLQWHNFALMCMWEWSTAHLGARSSSLSLLTWHETCLATPRPTHTSWKHPCRANVMLPLWLYGEKCMGLLGVASNSTLKQTFATASLVSFWMCWVLQSPELLGKLLCNKAEMIAIWKCLTEQQLFFKCATKEKWNNKSGDEDNTMI